VKSTLDSLAKYFDIGGIELNVSIGDATSASCRALAGAAAASLGSLLDIVTSSGAGGVSAG
jgi:hypothetical protein